MIYINKTHAILLIIDVLAILLFILITLRVSELEVFLLISKQYAISQLGKLEDSISERWAKRQSDKINISKCAF